MREKKVKKILSLIESYLKVKITNDSKAIDLQQQEQQQAQHFTTTSNQASSSNQQLVQVTKHDLMQEMKKREKCKIGEIRNGPRPRIRPLLLLFKPL